MPATGVAAGTGGVRFRMVPFISRQRRLGSAPSLSARIYATLPLPANRFTAQRQGCIIGEIRQIVVMGMISNQLAMRGDGIEHGLRWEA